MDFSKASKRLKGMFAAYKSITAKDDADIDQTKAEKLYELYVLAVLLRDLANRGYGISFVGNALVFKKAPGLLRQSEAHFDVTAAGAVVFQVFVDIEVQTLGSSLSNSSDASCHHELDIAVVAPGLDECRPTHEQVALGVECKSGAFGKSFVREILGLRRELSYLRDNQESILTKLSPYGTQRLVPAEPASELWLAHIAPNGRHYRTSPCRFGIELKHIPV